MSTSGVDVHPGGSLYQTEVVSDEISSTFIVNADPELNNQHQNVVFIYEEDIDYVNFDSSQIVAVD